MNKQSHSSYFFMIIFIVGLLFLRSGFEKVTGGSFVSSLPATLRHFADDNPYPEVKSFLTTIAEPNAILFAYLTIAGEVVSGFGLIISSIFFIIRKRFNTLTFLLYVTGITIAALLNITFWLSSAWISPAGDSLNLLLISIELLGFVYLYKIVIPQELLKK